MFMLITSVEDEVLPWNVLESMRRYAMSNSLRKAALNMVASGLTSREVSNRKVSGSISSEFTIGRLRHPHVIERHYLQKV